MEVRTIKLTWKELDCVFEEVLDKILGKSIKCSTDFDDYSYWAVRFVNYSMPVGEVEQVCQMINANEEERKEALPPEEESFSNDFGMSIADKLLSWHLGCAWKKIYADEDALYLIDCFIIAA